jgi:hypothetical protein
MGTTRQNRGARDGAALVTVMALILVLSMVLAWAATSGSQRAFTARRLGDYARAQAIAEAGAHQAFSILATNFSARTNSMLFPMYATFGGGRFEVSIRSFTNTEYQVLVISTGYCGDAMCDVVLDSTRDYTPPTSNDTPSLEVPYSLLAGGSIEFGGNVSLSATGALIHCNNGLILNGSIRAVGRVTSSEHIHANGAASIDGPADAKAFYLNKQHNRPGSTFVGGDATISNVPPVTVPTIDLTPYYIEAKNNGQVYTNLTWSDNSTWDVPGGIIWVVGTFRWTGNGDIVGCIIAEDSIDKSGGGDQIRYARYPAMVARDGSIDITGNGNYEGLIYTATGDIEINGGGVIKGAVMAKRNVNSGGGWSALITSDAAPVPPNVDTNSENGVVFVSAWQK